MKKWLLCFSFIAFIYSLCKAQDTIFFKSGEKDAVTIVSFGKKTINFVLQDTVYTVNQSRINYIKYKDGIRYSFKDLAAKFDSSNRALNTEMQKYDSTDCRPVNIKIGVGGSSIEADALNNANIPDGELGPYFTSQSPAYNFMIDYTFIRWLSIGIAGTYQSASDNPSEEPQNGYVVNLLETEKITRYNYSVRILYHLLKYTNLDIYAGVRAGVSSWKEQIVSNNSPPDSTIYKTSVPSSASASLQVLVGCIVPLYHCLGIHAELGIGTPYFFEGGITFRIKTRKLKPQ